jgi:hypothetical protein
MYISVVLVYIISGALAMAAHTKPPSDRCILLKVQVSDRNDIATLVNMGLDIWEFQQDGAIVRVTDDERKRIQESGFIIEVITENVYEYTETISKKQFSLLAEPTEAQYRSYGGVIESLIALEDSGVAQTYIIGSTHEERDIWAVKISDNPSEDEEEPGALFFGCQHAREWIAVEVPLYIGQYLADNYDTDAEVKHLVDNCEIWIVPVVNPDGYEYSRNTDRMWRKNRRDNGDGTFGVDLNRNWGYMWGGPGSSGNTSDYEIYRGPSAFSEPETQAVRDLILSYDFRVIMDYHSFGQMTCSPWGYTVEPCPDDAQMSSMTFGMREIIRQTSGAIYIDWSEGWAYLVSGGMGDWSYGELGIYSFTIELRPVTFSQGGFRLPENQIIPTCEENLPVALYLISYAAADYGIENLTTGQTYNSIQLAINDAIDGDEIVVNPGVYHENISFIDKNLTLRSTDPNDPNVVAATVINIEDLYQGPVITMSGSRNEGCLFDGLTITGGEVGISCGDAYPTIRNCTIVNNGLNAIEFWEGCEPPTIIDCTIIGQVAEVYSPALVAYWQLDETEGTIAYDSIGESHGKLVGEPLWQPDGGVLAGALQFDGIDDYVNTEFFLNPADGAFSVFIWVNGGVPGQAVLSQAGAVNWLYMDSVEGCLMTKLVGTGRFTGGYLSSTATITDGEWHHIGFVWDGSCRHLYIDGVEVANDDKPLLGLNEVYGNLYFGVGSTLVEGTYFSGLIDDVRIYNRVVIP